MSCKSCCRECQITGGSLEGSPGLSAQTGCQVLLVMTACCLSWYDATQGTCLVLPCPCPSSFQNPGQQLTQEKNNKPPGYTNFFLNTFISAPICCWAWGRSIKTDKNESTNLWYSTPKLGRLPGAGAGAASRVSWEEGEEAGEGEGEKMNSCKAIKPASLPYCPKKEAI